MTAVQVIKRAAQIRNNVNSFQKKVLKFPDIGRERKRRKQKKSENSGFVSFRDRSQEDLEELRTQWKNGGGEHE